MIPITDLKVVFGPDGQPRSGEIVFSHVDDQTGIVRHFAIERIVKHVEHMAERPPIIEFPLDTTFAMYAMTRRGIEQHRLSRITALDIAHYPIMLADMPGIGRDVDGTKLIIDGHHRYVRAALIEGWKTLRGYVLPEALWSQFLVDVPDEINAAQKKKLDEQHVNPIDSHIP